MSWVLLIWTVWETGGYPTVNVQPREVYYPSRMSCEIAMEDFTARYTPYTEEGFGYTLKCMERATWEILKQRDVEAD